MPSKMLLTMKWLENELIDRDEHTIGGGIPGNDNEKECHVDPAEESELLLEIASLERHHKADETKRVQSETQDTMVCSKQREISV